MYFRNRLSVAVLLFLVLTSCKKWEDHNKVTNPDLNQNLSQAIAANGDLSKFKELVTKAGLDSLLQSSKTYTVWAPTNAALQTLDPAISNDPAKLKSFVMNHIANQVFFKRDATPGTRIQMLNGKYIGFTGNGFDSAKLILADKYVSNGVLHVIDKSILVLPNLWEYINATTGQYLQNSFIAGLNFTAFDASLATVDSISATTGLPIYKPGSGLVLRNRFNDRVYDFRKEDKLYTYFVIDNAGFTLESDSLKKYYPFFTQASTDSLAKWNTVKDLAVEGLYPPGTLPAALLSKFGVTVPLNSAFIINTKMLSNGIVYVFSKIDVPTVNKFKEILIQGENPSGFMADRTGNTQYRIRTNPVTSQNFSDIVVSGHGLTGYYSYYDLSEIPAVKYKVYASAVNDFQTAAFSQSIVVKNFLANPLPVLATLPYTVPLSSAAGAYNEVLLGEFTPTTYGPIELQLTASGTNPIVLNYLRLVPVP